MRPVSLTIYIAVFVVMVVASTVQASTGFGQGLVAAPLLRLLHPDLLPAPIVIVGLLVAISVAKRNSRRSDLPEIVPAVLGRFVGIGIAVALLAWLSEGGMSIAIGVIVLGFVALRLADVRIPRTRQSLVGAGVFSGIGGTIAALGGAPMALLYQQHAEARDFRGPMGAYTVVGSVLTVIVLTVIGELDGDAAILGLLLVPPVIVGMTLARWVTPIIDRGYLRPLVLGLSAVSATGLILGELL